MHLVPLMVRLPDDLRGRLERAATDNDRSMNKEVIFMLQHAVEKHEAGKIINWRELKDASKA